MDGIEDYFQKGDFQSLYELTRLFLEGENITTKVDGAPAIVMWSEFPGLPGPGVSFKTIIKQTKDGNPRNVFTNDQEIDDFAREKEYGEDMVGRRIAAFKYALKCIAPYIKPGIMLWGDTLFTPATKQMKDGKVLCTPNTLTYAFDSSAFPGIESAEFGICIHTVIDRRFSGKNIKDTGSVLDGNPPDAFILTTEQTRPETSDLSKFIPRLEEVNDMAMDIQDRFTPELSKSIGRARRNRTDLFETMRADKKNKELDDDYLNSVAEAYGAYVELKEDIVSDCSTPSIQTFLNGQPDAGEGYVIFSKGKSLKMVSTGFTQSNKEHMKQSRLLKESVNGDYLSMWTSSKDSNLFKYFIGRQLTFGNSGGSQYGFALYAVLEPPFSPDAAIGYSKEVRSKLYGDNIFEFRVPTSKVFFLMFDEYRKTNEGRDSTFDTFIPEQLDRFGIDLSREEMQYIAPTSPEDNTSVQAMRMFKLFSRKLYQNRNGTLKSPFAGFVYKGKLDGKVFVGWNPYQLEPVKVSNDNGDTWKDIDRNDPEVVALMKGQSETDDGSKDEEVIFDGNRTKLKEQAYRLLMAYNSNDGFSADGKELSMSEGIFYNIVIHDDKTIDAQYRFNRPITDSYIHYFRPSTNQFLMNLAKLGFRINKLDCGLKLGSETQEAWSYQDVPAENLPKEFEGGLELINQTIDRPIDLPCKIGKKKMVLIKCEIQKDVFDGWDVVLTDNEKKLNWTNPELKDQLVEKYDWAKPDILLDAKPEKPAKKSRSTKKGNAKK